MLYFRLLLLIAAFGGQSGLYDDTIRSVRHVHLRRHHTQQDNTLQPVKMSEMCGLGWLRYANREISSMYWWKASYVADVHFENNQILKLIKYVLFAGIVPPEFYMYMYMYAYGIIC